MLEDGRQYDLALSFAGAQRALAKEFKLACEALGLSVFYDEDVAVQMWGRDFIPEFRRVYGGELARYVVPFVSAEYLAGPYPMDEFYTATTHAVQRVDDPYVLPIVVGHVQIPEKLLRSSVAYLRFENYTIEQLARIAADRVRGPAGHLPSVAPAQVTTVQTVPAQTWALQEAAGQAPAEQAVPGPTGPPQVSAVRLPKVAPARFSKYATLEAGLARIGERFSQAAPELEQFGYTFRVRIGGDEVDVRVEALGGDVYGLKVQLKDWFGGDQLTMSYGWPRPSNSGVNAWASAEWDPKSNEGRFRLTNLSLAGSGEQESLVSADEIFELLWQNIIEYIEQTHGRRR